MLLLTLGAQKFEAKTAADSINSSIDEDLRWLAGQTKRILNGSRIALNNVTLFSPDASGHYKAQYTRDFYYALSGTPSSFWDPREVKTAIKFTFDRQRSDGCMPDKVAADGRTGYAPGPIGQPMADHAWDNGPFAALLLAEASERWPEAIGAQIFCALAPRAERGLAFAARATEAGPQGPGYGTLLWNEPRQPNCTYGFTDNVAKTGRVLFTSLLLFEASERTATVRRRFSCDNRARESHGPPALDRESVSRALDNALYDETSGLWLAATDDNRLPDVWGSLYAVSLGLGAESRRRRALSAILGARGLQCSCCADAPDGSPAFLLGQVRHLPVGCFWDRCIMDHFDPGKPPCSAVPKGTYQNGAFWATPLPYLARAALAIGSDADRTRALAVVAEALHFFKHGSPGLLPPPAINEAVNPKLRYTGARDYFASAAGTLSAGTILLRG
jgi:hypothetical protein